MQSYNEPKNKTICWNTGQAELNRQHYLFGSALLMGIKKYLFVVTITDYNNNLYDAS